MGYKSFDIVRLLAVEDVFRLDVESGCASASWARRTRVVDNCRDLQRGVLLQVFAGKATISVYAFNPENSNRYGTVALGFEFQR